MITKLTLEIADKVKKGDVLFELDDKDLQTKKTSNKTEIAGAKLAVETHRLNLEKAMLNFDHVKELFTNKLVASVEWPAWSPRKDSSMCCRFSRPMPTRRSSPWTRC